MGRRRLVRMASMLTAGILVFTGGLSFSGSAMATAISTALTTPNITLPFSGNLGTIQITGIAVNPGQSDDIIITLPGGVKLNTGDNPSSFISVPQYNPDSTVSNAFWAGPNGGSVVADTYVGNTEVTSTMISFWIAAAPSSPGFSGFGTVLVNLPVISISVLSPGPIEATVSDTAGIIPRAMVGSADLVGNPGFQLGIETSSLPEPILGQAYDATIDTDGGGFAPYTFYASSGQLPPGLSLSASDGTITGIPGVAGTYSFTVTVRDNTLYTASQSYTMTVNPPGVTVPPVQPATPTGFSDISSSWAKQYILEMAKAGIVSGYPDGTFRPNDLVTRAQFVKMLDLTVKLAPIQNTSVLNHYKDYASFQAWEVPWLAAAVQHNVIAGYPDGTLRPDQTVTRLEAAVMLGRNVTGRTPMSLTFADRDAVPAWATNDVALDLGATKGHGLFGSPVSGFFIPDQGLSRAAAAAGLAAFLAP